MLFFCAYDFSPPDIEATQSGIRPDCVLAIDPSLGKWIVRSDVARKAQGKFAPGSAIKPFTILAAFDSGARVGRVIHCEQSSPETPVKKSCWYRPGHGVVDVEKAIAFSCDRWFIELARMVKWEKFLSVVQTFGLIGPKEREELEAIDSEERIDVMVGLSAELRVSPVDMLEAYSALFNGGFKFDDRGGESMSLSKRIKINNAALAVLTKGMLGASRYGTASEIGRAFPDKGILSKTGTAIYTEGDQALRVVDRNRTHAWYIGLCPQKSPRAAVLVFVPLGTGAHDAVPLALKIWPTVFSNARD